MLLKFAKPGANTQFRLEAALLPFEKMTEIATIEIVTKSSEKFELVVAMMTEMVGSVRLEVNAT
jgi:hypothetical protein